ncbi:PH domain-containing protein [Membranihabitans marinus]|uniref:hypothetical protein n=1 Tax=Membranihabitans marinus TaxID=1227546 RepID=UPI001F2955CB|nr:hypothetical protein [Membranihabitans marinus]
MEMELGSALVGAIAIIICILPFAIMSRSKKQKRQILLDTINDLANQNQCIIHKSDVYPYFAIGIDEDQGRLFYFKKNTDKELVKTILLSEIRTCKVVKSNTSINRNGDRVNIIEKQCLTFHSKDPGKPDISLEFFNADDSVQPCGEIQASEEWMKLINRHIS